MKTLLILRHAKSSWKDMSLPDHDRPLNKRGKRNTRLMGALLEEEGIVPELILASTAVRARETAARVATAAGFEGELRLQPELYHAAPDAYLDLLATLGDGLERVMVVGHNPGLEKLLTETTGVHERFPTSALAQVEYEIDHWYQVIDHRGRLVHLWRPRELE